MLELWVDDVPPTTEECQQFTAKDLLRLIRNHNVQICSADSQTAWRETIPKWQQFFDDMGLTAAYFETITYWKLPMFKPKSELDTIDYEASYFLRKSPDCLLRIALQQNQQRILSCASEFKSQFAMLIGNSHRVSIYDRYLLKIQAQLMTVDGKGSIGYNEQFVDKGAFIETIRGLNLILESLPNDVQELAVHSDMLDWYKFKQEAEKKGLTVNQNEFYDWIPNARSAQEKAMEFISQNLISPREIIIEFYDCWLPNSERTRMEHDRYVCYSQSRSFISSGGFRNVSNDVQGNDLGTIELRPKTFLMRIVRDASLELSKENRRIKKIAIAPNGHL